MVSDASDTPARRLYSSTYAVSAGPRGRRPGWMSQVLAGPDWRAGRLAVVVTFDEAENGGENTVLTVVVAPGLHGVVADTALTHQSWTRWMSDLVGATAPGAAGSAPSLGAAFGL